jgi:hypothetical protein
MGVWGYRNNTQYPLDKKLDGSRTVVGDVEKKRRKISWSCRELNPGSPVHSPSLS